MNPKQPLPSLIQQRKVDHLDIAGSKEASFRQKTTLLEQVHLVHQALPECHLDEIDLSVEIFGKKLNAPLMISGMTGGTVQAKQINQDLARAAQTLGIGFGLGSQRAMLLNPSVTETYQVRDVAPSIPIFANIGLIQARELSSFTIKTLLDKVSADALCLHLNPAMEMIQSEGDRDFRGGLETIKRIKGELEVPLVIKETGCGLSKRAGESLLRLGITTVDVSGAGGTSWVGVETLRTDGPTKDLGEELWDWGIPTAVSTFWMSQLGFQVISTGGLRQGLDVTSALSLGATLGGVAAPALWAQRQGGYAAVVSLLNQVIQSIKVITFLSGCKSVKDLRTAPRVLGPTLQAWLRI